MNGGGAKDWLWEGSSEYDQTVAHHLHIFNDGGIGAKPSDYRVVPLQASQHVALHHFGDKRWWKDNCLNPVPFVVQLLARYCKNKDNTLELLLQYQLHQDQFRLLENLELQVERERG